MLQTQTEQQIIQHLSQVLSLVHASNFKQQHAHSISAIVKKNTSKQPTHNTHVQNQLHLDTNIHKSDLNVEVTNFTKYSEKFSSVGKSLGKQAALAIDNNLKKLAVSQKTVEIRFWGVIHGKQRDYYIVQGVKKPYVGEEKVGNYEKNGVGVNYYSYWVTNDIYEGVWVELPDIEPHHIQTARKIKKLFSGDLEQKVESYPQFVGVEKHYLKAQLVRITHGCQLVPVGIYKINDENPKIIEYEDEVKIAEFETLNSLEGWAHKNEMVLNLGRCSHYVDMSLPEQEIEVKQQELTQNDPEIERLRVIVEDKIPEELAIGVESVWVIGVNGNSQVFTKQDSNLVYGVIALKNIYWPGWTTIGYTNGFANIYIGNGLKSIQPSTSVYENANLQLEAQEMDEYPEPFPLVLPPEPVEQEEQQNVDDQ